MKKIGLARVRNGLYYLENPDPPRPLVSCVDGSSNTLADSHLDAYCNETLVHNTITDFDVWHSQLGHISRDNTC